MFFRQPRAYKKSLRGNHFGLGKIVLADMCFHQLSLSTRLLPAGIKRYESAVFIFLMHVVLHTLENEFCVTLVFDSERFTKSDR